MDTQVAYILSLGVVKEFRKHGIGKRQKVHGLNHCCPPSSYYPLPLSVTSEIFSSQRTLSLFLVQIWGQIMSSQCVSPPHWPSLFSIPPRSVMNRSVPTPRTASGGHRPPFPRLCCQTWSYVLARCSVLSKNYKQTEKPHFPDTVLPESRPTPPHSSE